jgi:hypothetical protein
MYVVLEGEMDVRLRLGDNPLRRNRAYALEISRAAYREDGVSGAEAVGFIG